MSSSNDNHAPRPERRGSLSLSEYFSSNRLPQSTIGQAASQASQRRASIASTSSSPPQFPSGFGLRRSSVSSVSSTSSTADENAVDDVDGSPTSPLARRMSWGATAFRNVRIPGTMGGNMGPKSASATSPVVSRGFWDTAPRDPQPRRQSFSTMPTPPTDLPPAKEMPKKAQPQKDIVQERILKGELYMD